MAALKIEKLPVKRSVTVDGTKLVARLQKGPMLVRANEHSIDESTIYTAVRRALPENRGLARKKVMLVTPSGRQVHCIRYTLVDRVRVKVSELRRG